jgi:hypothetical protein
VERLVVVVMRVRVRAVFPDVEEEGYGDVRCGDREDANEVVERDPTEVSRGAGSTNIHSEEEERELGLTSR